jgi:GH24 family phage-related lysozyme (muramidase)
VLNNPVRFNDPTGHDVQCPIDGDCYETCDYYCAPPINPSGGAGGNNGGGDSGGSDLDDMETSSEGEEFIKYWEDRKLYPYEDAGGTCTIGWGHVLPNDGNGCRGWPKKTYGNGITTQTAQMFFDADIKIFEKLLHDTLTVDLTQAQFDALVSYTFNTGDQTNNPYFVKNIPELINSGDLEAAAEAIRSGPNTTGPDDLLIPKLVERRQREADLFLFGVYFP